MASGMVDIPSRYSVPESLVRLEAILQEKGLTIFARVDHSGEAKKVGLEMRPTQLVIFGSPKGGTPLMQSIQTIGIDLPLKALVWQDVSGKTWLSYNDPSWLAKRHGLGPDIDPAVNAITAALSAVARKATASP